MSLPLSQELFDSPELTTAAKWWRRVLQPINAALVGFLGNTAWQPLTLINSWTAFAPATYGTPAYRVRDGILYLRGAVGGGTAPVSTIANLPAAVAPSTPQVFFAIATVGIGRIDIRDTGAVQLAGLGTSPAAARTSVFLDGIRCPVSA